MLLAARNSFLIGRSAAPVFLNWLQSDGTTGYVDTGFMIRDPHTELQVSASFTSGQSAKKPLVCSGTPAGIDGNDTTRHIFGFAAIYTDRLLYFRTSTKGWWSRSNAADAKWGGGAIHNLAMRATSTTSCSATLDGNNVTMQINVNSSLSQVPADSQVIFGSKFDGVPCLINNVYKVRRVAYRLNSNTLADFRAASVNGVYGFYDIVASTFHPATGTLISGGELV